MQRPRVIFIHCMKTAGTSLMNALAMEYGADRVMPSPLRVVDPELLFPLRLGKNPLEYQMSITPEDVHDYDVVMGHFDWHIVERLPDWRVITMVRNPVHQIQSLYRFIHRRPYMRSLHPMARRLRFEDWVRSDEGRPFLNGQTKFLSGHGVADVDVAIRNLQDERVAFGLVERFSESLALFNRVFGWNLQERHDKSGGAAEYEDDGTIAALQADDMRLWRVACELFDAQ
jgi:hypothetical protein